MVTHIVMFKLRGEADEVAAAASKFKAGLEALPAKIAELKSIEVFIDNSSVEGNWTLSLIARCDSYADLTVYAAHPAHLDCVAIIKPLVAERACVDAE